MKFGVVQFPGSNCDHDTLWALGHDLGQQTAVLWHKDTDLQGADVVVLPGGFAYGDYLRAGAIARFSPIMREVIRFAERGGPVIGICNGFQVLCESGLLPGVLMRNASLRFACRYVHVRVENPATRYTRACGGAGVVLELPIAHGEGNFTCDAATLAALREHDRVVFRYCEANGSVSAAANPNGSTDDIAGIVNAAGNVLGMMPHPERACDPILMGRADGARVFRSVIESAVAVAS